MQNLCGPNPSPELKSLLQEVFVTKRPHRISAKLGEIELRQKLLEFESSPETQDRTLKQIVQATGTVLAHSRQVSFVVTSDLSQRGRE
jgi:hypothetical protein